jgi:hypothetical protein
MIHATDGKKPGLDSKSQAFVTILGTEDGILFYDGVKACYLL